MFSLRLIAIVLAMTTSVSMLAQDPTVLDPIAPATAQATDGSNLIIRDGKGGIAEPVDKTAPTIEKVLEDCDGITLMIGAYNILLPKLKDIEPAQLAKRVLSATSDKKEVKLLCLDRRLLIQTPQKDFNRPDLQIAREIMDTILGPKVESTEELLKDPKSTFRDIFENADPSADGPVTTPFVRVFRLQHAPAKEAARVIEQLYQREMESLTVDERSNTVFVRCEAAALEKIEQLVKTLDNATPFDKPKSPHAALQPPGGTQGSIPGVAPNLEKGNAAPTALDLNRAGREQQFSFYVGVAADTVDGLRSRYHALERESRHLAAQSRRPASDPGITQPTRQRLRETIRQTFEARQALQRAELAEFAKRLKDIQRSLETRNRIAQQIIDRRMEELLDPNLEWKPSAAQGAIEKDKSSTTPASIDPESATNSATSVDSPSLAQTDIVLAKTPDELHELLTTRNGQVEQIKENMLRWEERRTEGRDPAEVDDALQGQRDRLKEYQRKLNLAEQEWLQQIKLLEVVLTRDQSRLETAEQSVREFQRLFDKGYMGRQELRAAQLQQQEAQVAVQRAKSLLQLYQTAGEGLISRKTESVDDSDAVLPLPMTDNDNLLPPRVEPVKK